MNSQKYKEFAKSIITILIVIYVLLVGQQFFLPKGYLSFSFNYSGDGYIKIVSINDNSPFKQTDVAVNDVIISVNGEDIKDKSKEYITHKIMGKPNTEVVLKIKKGNEIKDYQLTRIPRKINWFPL